MIDFILIGIALFGLIIGSITDIKKREIPDWISYFLVLSAFGARLIYSITTNDWMFTLYGLLGFAIFFGLATVLFYTGQWGGGDSKLLIGMGIIFATTPKYIINVLRPELGGFHFLVGFTINLFLVGAVYSFAWSFVLSIIRFKEFKKVFVNKFKNANKIIKYSIYTVSGLTLIGGLLTSNFLIKLSLITISVMIIGTSFIFLYIKSVEKACMYKKVLPSELVEGDWVLKNVMIDNKIVYKTKKTGIEKIDIEKLIELEKENKVNKITIREGVPFIPSFLIAFFVTSFIGNLLTILMGF